ncbi:hypothetical protein SCOR_05260 [Sulfidibacter corallicola]|uniref:AAA domain-containing protein n=1 Tax=Sulfidibacter corallicola TaxID=2818388 RepID=A0A8A4TS12_SULCO|nr:hypothetical protein [Sulfidibacter corallicola]QTD51818.1 hypothetical protein J3U87_05050 [Sulfidibacter corallicola]
MAAEQINDLKNVFGTAREVPKTYVEREGIDDRFLNDITRDKHIVIHGASKQGKTCLRKYHLEEKDYIVIQSSRDSTKASLYEMLLKHAGVKCEVSNSVTLGGKRKLLAKLTAGVSVPFFSKGSVSAGGEHEKTRENKMETTDFEIDPEDANDVVRVLEIAGFERYIVVEDFHYLDENVQQAIAFDLKLFHEVSNFTFIIVGVWLETNKLTIYNGDLSGRIATINADHWEACYLHKVIEEGESLLNVTFPKPVKEVLVKGCQGTIGLLQEICYRLCEKHKIWKTQEENESIGTEEDVRTMLRSVADEQAARYRNFLTKFAEGLGVTQLEMYKWICYTVVTSPIQELRRGLRPNNLFHRIRAMHPSSETLQHNNVLQALNQVGKVQFRHKLQPLIFDFSNGELVVVDANFLVFIETHSEEEFQEYLGLEVVK